MKKLTFKFSGGNTPIVFVYFYKDDLKEKLSMATADDFDVTDFLSTNELRSIWLGRGLCREGEPTVEILQDGTPVSTLEDDELYLFDGDILDDEETGNILGGNYESMIDVHADPRFFGEIGEYKFAAIEKVVTSMAVATVTIDVDDAYKWSDFDLIFLDVDTGGSWGESFTQIVYSETGLENELFGIKYKGQFYPLDCEYEGGVSEWTYYECTDGAWESSFEITNIIEELVDSW